MDPTYAHALLDHTADVVFVVDAASRLRYANRAAVRVLGLEPRDYVGTSALALVHPDDVPLVAESLVASAATGTVSGIPIEVRVRHADGSWRTLELLAENRLADPAIAGVIVCARPVGGRQAASEHLADVERRIAAMFDEAAIGMAQVSIDGRYLRVNRELAAMVGYEPTELVGMSLFDITAAEHHAADREGMRQMLANELPSYRAEKRYLHRDGHDVWVELTSVLVRDHDGRPLYFSAQFTDVTARVRAQEALVDSEARYRLIFDHQRDAVMLVDQTTTRLVDVNDAAARMYGYPRDDMIGMDATRLGVDPDEWTAAVTRDLAGSRDEPRRAARVHVRSDGREFPVETTRASFALEGNAVLLVMVRDVTEIEQARRVLEHEATHDVLTDLPNRRLFQDLTERALARRERHDEALAVLFVDLDRFKAVNDTFGHEVGDKVLQETARRFETAVRAGDVVARLGGDEFVVLCEHAGSPEAMREVGERLVEVSEQPFRVGGVIASCGASVGIAFLDRGGVGASTLVREADRAVYDAKRSGRAGVVLVMVEPATGRSGVAIG